MSYKALLFCPDEKTAHTVTQVLTELDFQVEPCNEPFNAVKKLTTEHFDALVVDCDNEQNAMLLFKSARNSGSNQTSLAVAVVEGQSGVAKAFRIGANLVLTKPINVEQSKGTVRVARGLLRKTENLKPAGAVSSNTSASTSNADDSSPAFPSQIPTPTVPPTFVSPPPQKPAISASSSSMFELEEEPGPKPEPAEAALLESMPDPVGTKGRVSDSTSPAPTKQNPWQPISKPMAAALHQAAEAGKTDSATGITAELPRTATPRPTATTFAGAAAAPAPAKKAPPVVSEPEPEPEPPLTSLSPAPTEQEPGGSKNLLIAAVALIAVLGGYFGWTKIHTRLAAPPAQKTVAPQLPQTAQAPVPAGPQQGPATTTAQPNAEVTAAPVPPAPEKNLAPRTEVAPSAPKKVTAPPAPTSTDAEKPVKEASSPEAIIVANGAPTAAAQTVAPQEPEPAAPSVLAVAPNEGSQAISKLVNTPPAVPQTAPQTLKVSQGISQGLLVKKVPPVYPAEAMRLRIQGSVELLATIGKDGSINSIKPLSGDARLVRAAVEAVKQWKYQPYYLDNQPVEIQTQITVKFNLP